MVEIGPFLYHRHLVPKSGPGGGILAGVVMRRWQWYDPPFRPENSLYALQIALSLLPSSTICFLVVETTPAVNYTRAFVEHTRDLAAPVG